MSDESVRRDAALAVVRVVLGVVFVMHGWQKYDTDTIDGVQAMFDSIEVPFAYASAVGVTLLEVIGGVALTLGVLVRPLCALFAANMAGAIYFAHADAGFFANEGGYEFVLVLGVVSAMFIVLGAGRFSVDTWLARGRTRVTSVTG